MPANTAQRGENAGGDGLATRRLTLREAAEILGVSKEAVRKRVIRGTIRSETGEDGRRYVYVDDRGDEARTHEPDTLISQMQERLPFLERELEIRTEEIRRRDTIIMNMTEAMKAISPPAREESSEPRESPVSAADGAGSVTCHRTRRESLSAPGGAGC
jgi:hypothetical protein